MLQAFQVAGLDTFTSYDDFVNSVFTNLRDLSKVDASYLAKGLASAEQVFQDGSRDDRKLFKKVIIVYASTYKSVT